MPWNCLIFTIGNIVDAFAVVATGFVIDLDIKCKPYDRYGKLKSWHLVGTILLLVFYILLFLPPLGIKIEEHITAYYASIFILVNSGYTIVAIAHSAIISKIAISEEDQVELVSI